MSYHNPFASHQPAGSWAAPPDSYTQQVQPSFGGPVVGHGFALPGPDPLHRPHHTAPGWLSGAMGAIALSDLLVLIALPILFVITVAIVGANVSGDAQVVGALMALVPLGVVLFGVHWMDRFEPEPMWAKVFAFLWGAGVATLISYFINTAALNEFSKTSSYTAASHAAVVYVAPLVEEISKGLVLLVILFARPRWLDSPVDGLVYAMLVGGGFAFTENILYFSRTIDASSHLYGGSNAVAGIFLVRGVLSPFAHALFTGMQGFAIGIAAVSRNRNYWLVVYPIGLVASIVLHALWNSGATSDMGSFLSLYVTVQMPVLLLCLAVAMWLRGRESATIRLRLGEYAQAGWFDANEVHMVSSVRMRRAARTWARKVAGSAGKAAMLEFQKSAIRLAFNRNKLIIGRGSTADVQDEGVLLSAINNTRNALHEAMAAA